VPEEPQSVIPLTPESPAYRGFDLLYEQGPCLVVNKSPGILTQAPPGIDSLAVRIKDFLKLRDHKAGGVYLGVPHRLDRPVSGVLVVAKHVRAARRLAEQFQQRTVEKKYWALLEGRLEPDAGTWVDFVCKVPDVAQAEIVPAEHPQGRLAKLHYRVLGYGPQTTWVEIELETGRMHQIRVQAASRSHPVAGDRLYGATTVFGPSAVDERARWIALHARSLRFRHPMTREWVLQTAPVSAAWKEVGSPLAAVDG
jgi:23S rRNA pseudouridine1911/1915/1917 synthase